MRRAALLAALLGVLAVAGWELAREADEPDVAIASARAQEPPERPGQPGGRGQRRPGPPMDDDGPYPSGPAKTARGEPDPRFPPVETLKLNEALWGVDVANTLKGIAVCWDGAALWVAGIATQRLALVDPQRGHPVAAVELDARGHAPGLVRADPKRRRLYWVSRQDGAIRAVDLDKRGVVASVDGEPPERPGAYPVLDAAVDPDTGTLWVANRRKGRVVGYDPSLAEVGRLPDVTAPMALAVRDGVMAVLDAPGRGEERIVRIDLATNTTRAVRDVPPASGPLALAWAADGTLLQVGRGIAALDDTGAPLWKVDAPALPDRAVVAGDVLAVLYSASERDAPPPEGLVVLYDVATGDERARVIVGYEAKFLDTDGRRVFVGNGGDGSVSVIDAATGHLAETWDVANAAEQLVVDPETGTRYILDRLGGSTIYTWRKGAAEVTPRKVGGWPSELAISGRTLVALSHYASALYRFDLDSGERLADVPLGVPQSRSDSLGDMDVASGVAAVVYPEVGAVVAADLAKGRVLWTKTPEWLRIGPGKGPGEATVKVDVANGRVYVATRTTVRALSLRDGAEMGEVVLPEARPKGYEIDPLWLDGDRLFVGRDVVRVPDLALDGRVELAMKVFWSGKDALLGLVPGRGAQPEELVEIDPVSLKKRRTWPLVPTGMMRLNPTYDPATKRVYATDMAEARVFAWPSP